MRNGGNSRIVRTALLMMLSCGCFDTAAERAQKQVGEELRAAIERASRDGAIVDFGKSTKFAWDILHVFQPYTSRERVEAQLGFKWSGASGSASQVQDAYVLLVFEGNRRVVQWLDFDRFYGDLNASAQARIPRAQARFRIGQTQGRRTLTLADFGADPTKDSGDSPRERLAKSLHQELGAVLEGKTSVADLGSATPFPWDTVHLFRAFTERREIEAKVGLSSLGLERSLSAVMEKYVLAVFVRGGRPVEWVDIERYYGALERLAPTEIRRDQARLTAAPKVRGVLVLEGRASLDSQSRPAKVGPAPP